MRLKMEDMIKEKQKQIVAVLEQVDGNKFLVDTWERPAGGGGISCVLQDGNVFEKAGVNISVVYGDLQPKQIQQMRAEHKSLGIADESKDFFCRGIEYGLASAQPQCSYCAS